MTRTKVYTVATRTADVVLTLLAAVVLTAVVIAWPARFGGASSFVFVAGPSMEPNLHSGDLVIARHRARIDVGDVVVYRVGSGPAIGSLVVHRVVGGTSTEGFITQGDANPTPDSFRPTSHDIVGTLWVHSGGGRALGTMLRLVITPWLWAVAGMTLAFVITWRIAGVPRE